ncbi:MAG: DEAD/DEAH box helicase, partial [Patescibacteria group bacterium]|nr:DEAD/DEAH box helicase [Patescibacteria group bacterium]
MLSLESKIEEIKKIGPAYLKKLERLKIKTIRDLFLHFPYRYDDFSNFVPIGQLQINQTATIQGKVVKVSSVPQNRWRKTSIIEALIEDKTGTIKAVWFNQFYLTQTLKPGIIINLSGKATLVKKVLSFSNPAYEIVRKKDFVHTGRLVPVYHETAGLSSRYLRYIIKPLLCLADSMNDFLPELIKKEFSLIDLNQAIEQIHFPSNLLSAQKARERLAFDELFLIQLNTLQQKRELDKKRAPAISFSQKLIKSFVKNLPFNLTNTQRIAAWEIFQDIERDKPMNRLLDGDVGSGKTIVALLAALQTAKAGYQTAFMAPTEILARQHFQTFNKFLAKQNLRIALLTRTESLFRDSVPVKISAKNLKAKLKKQIAGGKIDIIIGTHSLIQEDVAFKNLALAIVDEQ